MSQVAHLSVDDQVKSGRRQCEYVCMYVCVCVICVCVCVCFCHVTHSHVSRRPSQNWRWGRNNGAFRPARRVGRNAGVLQCVLSCVALSCSVFQTRKTSGTKCWCVAVCVAVCCTELQCVLSCVALSCSVFQSRKTSGTK